MVFLGVPSGGRRRAFVGLEEGGGPAVIGLYMEGDLFWRGIFFFFLVFLDREAGFFSGTRDVRILPLFSSRHGCRMVSLPFEAGIDLDPPPAEMVECIMFYNSILETLTRTPSALNKAQNDDVR